MRLAFWRTEKPVARPVLQPGADSPYVPRLGVWMESTGVKKPTYCRVCGRDELPYYVFEETVVGSAYSRVVGEGCGAKLVAQLRREREG